MLPSPKIVIIDDDINDVEAIVTGLYSLGTAAFGLHYSIERTQLPQFPCLRILFLDLHLTGSGGSIEQQVKTTIGIMAELLTKDNGPYIVVLWSGHILEGFSLFQSEAEKRLPLLDRPLPLQILALDKTDFITTLPDGDRRVDEPAMLKDKILDHIKSCPQLAALLSWEDDVTKAADDALSQIFQIARQRLVSEEMPLPRHVNRILGELAVASAGYPNAVQDAFRGVNDVLVQVIADRLQHRGSTADVANIWKEAVTEFRAKSELNDKEAALLNRFLHIEDGSLIENAKPTERGSVVNIDSILDEKFLELWGKDKATLLNEFCLSQNILSQANARAEWIMVQIQPPCDHAQQNSGLLPYLLGLRVKNLSRNKVSEIGKKKCLWLSPPLVEGSELYRLAFHLRFLVGLHSASQPLKFPVRYRLKDQIMSELTHELTSYSGRPGIISFPGQ